MRRSMFEHLVGKLFAKSERAHADEFHSSGKAINEKVRLYAKIDRALIEARTSGADAFAAIEAVLSWSKFESTVAEAQTLAQPEEFDFLALLDERYSSVRKFAPLLLAHSEFHAAPTATELLQALDVLRDRLRAGDIWVTGSRQYRDFETYLIPAATFKVMQKEPLPLDIDTNLPSYLAECRQRLEDTMTTVASKARDKTLPDVTLADGELHISPLRKNTPESAEAFAEKAYALMPHVKITEL